MRIVVCASALAHQFFDAVLRPNIPLLEDFELVETPEELVELLERGTPDVCLIGPRWLGSREKVVEWATGTETRLPKWMLATFNLTGALCVESALAGIDDVCDLREGFSAFENRLRLLGAGFIANDGFFPIPPRWTGNLPCVEVAIGDHIDARIVYQLLHGKSNTEIGSNVYLSTQTVNNRISQMIHRTGTANRTQLALLFTDENEHACARAKPQTLSARR